MFFVGGRAAGEGGRENGADENEDRFHGEKDQDFGVEWELEIKCFREQNRGNEVEMKRELPQEHEDTKRGILAGILKDRLRGQGLEP